MSNQKKVLECFNGNRELELSKQDIIKMAGLYYYHNTDKHAGEVLSRMVKSGLLKRVKKGVYTLGGGIKKKTIETDKNQHNIIFE